MQSQSWLGEVLTRDSTQEPPPNRPPEPGLGYLCLLLVKFEKKVSLSGTAVDRADRPVGWSRQVAGTIFFYLCCVSESEPSNASTCHLPGRSDSAFSVFFRLENPACQRAPPSSCSVVLDTKKCAKKDLCPGEDSRPEEGR